MSVEKKKKIERRFEEKRRDVVLVELFNQGQGLMDV